MNAITVGTRELKNNLSAYLRRVKARQTMGVSQFCRAR